MAKFLQAFFATGCCLTPKNAQMQKMTPERDARGQSRGGLARPRLLKTSMVRSTVQALPLFKPPRGGLRWPRLLSLRGAACGGRGCSASAGRPAVTAAAQKVHSSIYGSSPPAVQASAGRPAVAAAAQEVHGSIYGSSPPPLFKPPRGGLRRPRPLETSTPFHPALSLCRRSRGSSNRTASELCAAAARKIHGASFPSGAAAAVAARQIYASSSPRFTSARQNTPPRTQISGRVPRLATLAAPLRGAAKGASRHRQGSS